MTSEKPKTTTNDFPFPGAAPETNEGEDLMTDDREGQLHDDQSVDNPMPDSQPTKGEQLVDRQNTIANLSGG
ncbi:MAG: hypothetical protein Kow00121_29280 [Elainellaceae cyanobacterium]